MKFVAKFFLALGALFTRVGGRLLRSKPVGDNIEQLFKGDKFPFGVFIDAPKSGIYQLKMWLPSLEAVGENFFIVSGRSELVAEIRKISKRPVFVIPTNAVSRLAKVPGLKTWIYINNSKPNSDYVRFPQFTHVQLMHGDSEKTASFTPVNGMYSKLFVAGQAGIDRYERNGVRIAKDKFVKVGRPQLSSMQVGATSKQKPTLLICPTWGGSAEDEVYTSLALTPQMVDAAIEAGVRVVYRPHPYSFRSASDLEVINQVHAKLTSDNEKNQRGHLFGSAATGLSEADVINESTAMISDISGIVSDWLFSLKPYLLVSMDGPAKEFVKRYPVASGGLVLDKLDDRAIKAAVKNLLSNDELLGERKKTRDYYFEGANDKDLTKRFIDAVKETLK
ncbi:MAG: hypothetical protein RL166_485 [Actinomycetota bacterium]